MKNERDPMLPHGTDKCQCSACKLYFNSTYAFDKHRTGDFSEQRRCFSLKELKDKGWATTATGHLIPRPSSYVHVKD